MVNGIAIRYGFFCVIVVVVVVAGKKGSLIGWLIKSSS